MNLLTLIISCDVCTNQKHIESELKPTGIERESESANGKGNPVRKEPCSLNKDRVPSNVIFFLLLRDSDIPSFYLPTSELCKSLP